jgi:hypothetical protein
MPKVKPSRPDSGEVLRPERALRYGSEAAPTCRFFDILAREVEDPVHDGRYGSPPRAKSMPQGATASAISRRRALTLAAGAAALMNGARATAQTSTSVMPAASSAIEPFRVEISQAALDAERRQAMSFSISTLLIRNLHDVFGENDPARRRAAIDEIWTEEGVFYDPKSGVHRGRDEIDRVAGAIKATHPDFRYQPIAGPEELGNGGRIQWVSGRPGEAPAYAGTDFIIARDGRIAAVYLFFDKLP